MQLRSIATAVSMSVSAISIISNCASAETLALTIYNENLAMVRDQRDLQFSNGESQLEFPNVSAQIRPETAFLKAEGVSVLEQNFDFDLLSPEKLLEKAVGKTVTLVRVNPATGKEVTESAQVLSVNNGAIIKVGGRVEALRAEGMPLRVIFDQVPDTLKAEPTLSMLVNSDKAGRRQSQLSYLTGGLSWRADYVGQFDDTRGLLLLQGWITLTNNSGTAYQDASVQFVAGDINRAREEMTKTDAIRTMAASPSLAKVQQEALGDYHLYSLPRQTTILNNQTKQVAFLDAASVKANKLYRFNAWGLRTFEAPQNVDVQVQFKNDKSTGLGEPLPRGTVRLYGQDKAGAAQFLGEDSIEHTPEGALVSLTMGKAFDVTVKSTLEDRTLISRTDNKQVTEWTMAYKVKSAKAVPIRVEFYQNGLEGNWEVLKESFSHEKPDADTALWHVSVPAKGEAILRFTVRQRQ